VADMAQDQFCTLAWAKTTESLVRGKADEGLDCGDIASPVRSEKARFGPYLMEEFDGWLEDMTTEAL